MVMIERNNLEIAQLLDELDTEERAVIGQGRAPVAG